MTYEVVLDNSKMFANCNECVPMVLDAVGSFFNLSDFNHPTITGSNVLEDASDATYATWPEGSGTATIAIEVPPSTIISPIALHLRMMVLTSDPGGFGGHGEVFINTQSDGDSLTEISGFSDGNTSGFGFLLPAGIASGIMEVVVPLSLSAWSGTTFAEVAAAIDAGAYLDWNAWVWEAGSGTPTFRVYKAWIEKVCP